MNQLQRVLTALQCKEPDYVPTFEFDINKGVMKHLTGSEDILDAADILDLDGIVVRPTYQKEFISEKVYLDEWGCKRQVSNETLAVIIESPIKDLKDHGDYTFPDPYAHHRFEELERTVNRYGSTKAVILNVRDIFSDLRDLLGYENALVALVTEQDHVKALLDRIIEYNWTLAKLVAEKFDLTIVVTTDDIAANRGLIFSPKVFFELLGPKFKEVIHGFKTLGYYCIKHCDGYIMDVLDYWIDCGIDCIDPIDPNADMDLEYIKNKYGSRVCIKGNVNCETALVNGTEQEVEEEVRDCIRKAATGGGYILSSSNTIHSGVRPENYRAMLRALREYGKYPLDRYIHS